MLDLFARLTKILGKQLQDPYVAEIIEELGENAAIKGCPDVFPKAGISFLTAESTVHAVEFFVISPNPEDDLPILPYRGNLMAGITQNDTMEEVKRKIESMQSKIYLDNTQRFHCDFLDYSAAFSFDAETDKVSRVAIRVKW